MILLLLTMRLLPMKLLLLWLPAVLLDLSVGEREPQSSCTKRDSTHNSVAQASTHAGPALVLPPTQQTHPV
jgi:hypothetical protein